MKTIKNTLPSILSALLISLLASCNINNSNKQLRQESDSMNTERKFLSASKRIPFLEAIGIKADSLVMKQIPTPTSNDGLELSPDQAKKLLTNITLSDINSTFAPAYLVAIKQIGKNWMIAFKTDAETTYGLGYFAIYSPEGEMLDALYIDRWFGGDWEDLDNNHDITKNYIDSTSCAFTTDSTFSIMANTQSYIYNSITQTEKERDSYTITYNYRIDNDSQFVFLNREIDDYDVYKRSQTGQPILDKYNDEVYYLLNRLPLSDSSRFDKWNNLLYTVGDSIQVDRFFYKEFMGQLYHRKPSLLFMWIYHNRDSKHEILSTVLRNASIYKEAPFSLERIIHSIDKLEDKDAKIYLKSLIKEAKKTNKPGVESPS